MADAPRETAAGTRGRRPATRSPSPSRRPPAPVGTAVLVTAVLVAAGLVALSVTVLSAPSPSRVPRPASRRGVAVDPTAFAPGSCVAFPPTGGGHHPTVFLDAGHGGRDPGGVGTTAAGRTVEEATLTLAVERRTMALLRAAGYPVVVSRTGDSSVARLSAADVSGNELSVAGVHADVLARDRCADLAHAAVLVGIYFDAGYSSQNAGALTAYDADRPFSAASERLATLVQTDELAALNARGWGIPDDGVQPDSQLGSLSGNPYAGGLAAQAAAYDHLLLLGPPEPGYQTDPSDMPGAVTEPLYLTDPFEAGVADSAAGQAAMAAGIARAVEQFLAPPARHRPAGRRSRGGAGQAPGAR